MWILFPYSSRVGYIYQAGKAIRVVFYELKGIWVVGVGQEKRQTAKIMAFNIVDKNYLRYLR